MRLALIKQSNFAPPAGHKEEPISSPARTRNGKAVVAAKPSSGGGLGFVLGSRADLQVGRPEVCGLGQ